MNKTLFIEQYNRINVSQDTIRSAIKTIIQMESYLNKEVDQMTVMDIKKYMEYLVKSKQNTYENIIHFTRYFYYINNHKLYRHMMTYFNSAGVLENIIDRVEMYGSIESKEVLKDQVSIHPFGTESDDLPIYASRLLELLDSRLDETTCNKVLAGNNHQISKEVFMREREYYQKATSFEEYLQDRHQRKVQELEQHYKENKVWFEQTVTREMIDFVKQNQEVLSGVIRDKKLYITKIPYDTKRYLESKTKIDKQYHACHCSFVKENIKLRKEDIPYRWCYCSAGFAKYPFEVILDKELEVKLLETPLKGDPICRFEIDLTNVL